MSNVTGGRVRRLGLLAAMLTVLWGIAVKPAAAAAIQIGTLDWDAIAEDEDEYLFFCDAGMPCSRFTITNDLDDLTSSELALAGLPSADVLFEDVLLPGVLGGPLGSLSAAVGSFVWIASGDFTLVTVAFQLPNSLLGTLVLPNLTAPTTDPAAIFIVTDDVPPPSVPEPTTLLLVGSGLIAAARYHRGRRARLID
jgi:hypothetical protein